MPDAADQIAEDDDGSFLRINAAYAAVLDTPLHAFGQDIVQFREVSDHDVLVFDGLQIAEWRTADENHEILAWVAGKIEIGFGEHSDRFESVGNTLQIGSDGLNEFVDDIQASCQEQFFLVSEMVGQEAERHSSPFRNFFERCFGISVLAEKFFGSLEQKFFLCRSRGHGVLLVHVWKGNESLRIQDFGKYPARLFKILG